MFDITKTPVLVVSSPRTGSTYISNYIGKKYNLNTFLEPDSGKIQYMEYFHHYAKSDADYLLKVHAYNLKKYEKNIIETLLYDDNVFRVKIFRSNIINQIASVYVGYFCRNRTWHYENNYSELNDSVPIQDDNLRTSIDWVLYWNKQLHNLNVNYDLILEYETLPNIETSYNITPKPKNYKELCDTITRLL